MFQYALSVLTLTGKTIIAIEAVIIAAVLAVIIAGAIKVVRDKKNGVYDADCNDAEDNADDDNDGDNCGGNFQNYADASNGNSQNEADISDGKEDGLSENTENAVRDTDEMEASAQDGCADNVSVESEDEEKSTFASKLSCSSPFNKYAYNQLKNELLSYKGIKSRVTNGGDYFRYPGKQLAKIILIGSTLRIALALNPADFDYNLYHQRDRSDMKKYETTPMFVKVQSELGITRAKKLIATLMQANGIPQSKNRAFEDWAEAVNGRTDDKDNRS